MTDPTAQARDRSLYTEHPVAPDLRAVAVCTWTRSTSGAGALTVLPDGCVDIVRRSDGLLFVAGPDVRPAVHQHPAAAAFDGIRLRTGTAGTVLGAGAQELANQQVDLIDLWGRAAGELAARLDHAGSPCARRAALMALVRERLASAGPPDRQVLAATSALARGSGPVRHLAGRVGLSERQLHRRMLQQVGYGPKTLDRILRFRRFLELAGTVRTGERTLGWAAAAAGYADQSHLTRECRRLAGSTPSAVVADQPSSDV